MLRIGDVEMAHILIVDDEEKIRRMLSRLLTSHGYACTLSADAAEARRCLERQGFDLVLCDVNMLGESGIDLARHIQSGYEDTAVIMVTGVDDPKVGDSAAKAGAYGDGVEKGLRDVRALHVGTWCDKWSFLSFYDPCNPAFICGSERTCHAAILIMKWPWSHDAV